MAPPKVCYVLNLNSQFLFRVTGNGNCLFNACSIALAGDESLAVSLRCLTAIEMYRHRQFYAFHPLLELQYEHGAFSSINNAFAMSVSDAALDASKGKDCILALCFEASRITEDYQHATFICELALASVIGRPIEAYFPIRKADGDMEREISQRNSLEIMFNCTILPKEATFSEDSKVHVLRCASVPLDFVKTGKIPDSKDHFVPLVPLISSDRRTNETLFQSWKAETKLLPDFLKPRQQFASLSPVPCSSGHQQSVNSNAAHSSCKRTQLKMDDFVQSKKPRDTEMPNTPQSHVARQQRDVSVKVKEASNSFQEVNSTDFPVAAPLIYSASYDNGSFYNTVPSLSDSQKYDLLCHFWKPESSHNFPPNSKGRRFQFKWLKMFPWLAYSQLLNGALCINCVLFGGESSHNASKLQHLFRSPLTCWSKALDKLKDHACKSPIHATATLRAAQFRRSMENAMESIDVQLNTKVSEQVRENREKMKIIVGGIIFCGRQNIALRGHRDDSAFLENEANNPGNLQALFSFLSKYGNNKVFDDFLANAPKTATSRSKTTQNQIISFCGDFIRDTLAKEIRDAKFFSVLADEAADISNIEQIALVLRFVDQRCNKRFTDY